VLPLLAAVTIVAALLVTYPWEMLTLISAGYLALIPVSGRRRHCLCPPEEGMGGTGSCCA
jgi:phosphatidylserine synthase